MIEYSPDYRSSPQNSTTSSAGVVWGFVRLAQLKNKAILADMVNFGLSSIKVRHAKGINVLYANGSAKWVSLDQFINLNDNSANAWRKIPAALGNGAENSTAASHNDAMLNESLTPAYGVWADLDRAP
jgi:hypothetical protein